MFLSSLIAAAAAGLAWGLGYACGVRAVAQRLSARVDRPDPPGPDRQRNMAALTICAACLRPVSLCIDCTPDIRAHAIRRTLWRYGQPYGRRP